MDSQTTQIIILILTIISGIISYFNREKLKVMHSEINGRMSQLISATKKEGILEGTQAQKDLQLEIRAEIIDAKTRQEEKDKK